MGINISGNLFDYEDFKRKPGNFNKTLDMMSNLISNLDCKMAKLKN